MRNIAQIIADSRLIPHQGYRLEGYSSHFGIYRRGENVRITFKKRTGYTELFRVMWEPASRFLVCVNGNSLRRSSRHTITLGTAELEPGMYLVVADRNVCAKFYVKAEAPSSVGVVVPVFTEWGYHHDGFYQHNHRKLSHYLVMGARRLGLGKGIIEQLQKVWPEHLVYPYKTPANDSICLDEFYIKNPRWDHSCRNFFDSALNDLDCLWSEEYKAGIPLAAMLDKLGVQPVFFSDYDIHSNNPEVMKCEKLIFYSSELMTTGMFEYFKRLQRERKIQVLFWGMQGIGLKEIDYCFADALMTWKGQKSGKGLSGERVAGGEPSWGNEDGTVFGFTFPVPAGNDWRTQHTSLVIDDPADHLVKGISQSRLMFCNPNVYPHNNPGLTNAGGEFFEKSVPDATVIAHLDNRMERIGIGRYGVFTHVSPTYLPTFGVYFHHIRPEPVQILRNWIN